MVDVTRGGWGAGRSYGVGAFRASNITSRGIYREKTNLLVFAHNICTRDLKGLSILRTKSIRLGKHPSGRDVFGGWSHISELLGADEACGFLTVRALSKISSFRPLRK